MRFVIFLTLFLLITNSSFAQIKSDATSKNATEKKYSIGLKGWPEDLANQITQLIPNINKKVHDIPALNVILKKLDKRFAFNKLKLVQVGDSAELLLVAEISPIVKKITFEGLSEISEAEALSLMGVNISNILDEETLKIGAEKLNQFYREQGYRFSKVEPIILSEGAIDKSVVFKIHRKEKTKLIEILIEGIQQVSIQNEIQKKLQRQYRLSTLNQNELNKISNSLRYYLSRNGYHMTAVPSPQINFSADELSARLVFKLKNSARYRIHVINTESFGQSYLQDEVLKLDRYFSKDSNISSELIDNLKTFYIKSGYPHIVITTNEQKEKDLTHVYLNVAEGPYTKISEFRVIGQFSRPENFYKNKFFELASANIQNKIYIKEEIEQVIKNLLISIQNEGFVNAKFSRVFISTEREEPKNGILILQLDEGPQVEISEIKFTGVSDDNLAAIHNISQLKVKEKLSLANLESALSHIKNYYQQSGYIEMKILNENSDLVTYTDNNSKLSLNFNIQEGPKVTVQSIVIEGNSHTSDKLILIELDFKVGDILNNEKIDESVSRLQRSGHFNSVEIRTLEKDTIITQRTVVVRVQERDPGLKVLGIGLTDENRGTIHGYAGLAYRNFWGRGIGASLRSEANYNFADIQYIEHKHTFGFVFPYIFNSRARTRISATRSSTIADTRINKISEANTAVFSLEQDFTSHITGILSYTVSTYKDRGISSDDETKYGYSSESLVIGSITPTIDIDYRDNIFNPTKGSISRFSFEYAGEKPLPLGNNNVDDFYRVTAQTTHYFPFNKGDIVFVQSLRGGYIKNTDDRGEGIPFDKKGFLLGGRTTIRGFESSEFFPTTQEIGASYRLKTSSNYELIKSEIRFPISQEYDVSGALFYDGGRVKIEGVQLTNDWRDAAGVGIRYNTPVGPLSLEYAHKLKKKTGESDGAFHLSVGVF